MATNDSQRMLVAGVWTDVALLLAADAPVGFVVSWTLMLGSCRDNAFIHSFMGRSYPTIIDVGVYDLV